MSAWTRFIVPTQKLQSHKKRREALWGTAACCRFGLASLLAAILSSTKRARHGPASKLALGKAAPSCRTLERFAHFHFCPFTFALLLFGRYLLTFLTQSPHPMPRRALMTANSQARAMPSQKSARVASQVANWYSAKREFGLAMYGK